MSTYFNKSIPQNFTVSSSQIKCCLASSTGVQGKTLVSNSTSFADITDKCISSTVPVTNTSCNINFLFSQPFRVWPSAASYFQAHCEGKKKKIGHFT